MGRYNLLDEPWISVIVDKMGNTKKVSMVEFFKNAHKYLDMGGDTKTQDFAVMRVLIAVIHTVFSRVDSSGKPYEYFSVDDKFRQLDLIDEFDVDDYENDLIETWLDIWKMKKFPDIAVNYLEAWRDRFYLFDDKYPFFQVTKEDIEPSKLNKSKPSEFLGKNMNRKISESGNKTTLFSPKYDKDNNKEILNEDEIARWLINLQGYIGLSDKVIFGKEKYKSSKGWLFDLGGIFIRGENIFETLMLNCVLANKNQDNLFNIQVPCWEFESKDLLKKYISTQGDIYDNEVSLLTAWSRAVYIDSNLDTSKPFTCSIVKLPDVDHQDKFIEQMTIWRYNDSGDNKGKYTPRKHQSSKAIWRTFGLITGVNDENKKPGVIEWLNNISSVLDSYGLDKNKLCISSVSMQDDANATSWVPTDEIIDQIIISEKIFLDQEWLSRINSTIEDTKKIVGGVYKRFIDDIKQIRNMKDSNYSEIKVEEMYYSIDSYFREWLSKLGFDDTKEDKVFEWNARLKKIILNETDKIIESSSNRDYKGIVMDERIKNIATSYNYFVYSLNSKIKIKGDLVDGE